MKGCIFPETVTNPFHVWQERGELEAGPEYVENSITTSDFLRILDLPLLWYETYEAKEVRVLAKKPYIILAILLDKPYMFGLYYARTD